MGTKIRKIEPKMIDFLDERLKNNSMAKWAYANNEPRILMTKAAEACVGIREKTGRNDGYVIELIQETVGSHHNEAYCMSFNQTLIAYAEVKLKIRSPIYVSESCAEVWKYTPESQRVKFMPLPGALAYWRYEDGERKGLGHTGIILACDDDVAQLVEANTTKGNDPNGKIVREGGGIYYTTRKRGGVGDMKEIGFLKPF